MTFHRYLAWQLLEAFAGVLIGGMLVISAGRLLQYLQEVLEGKLDTAVALLAALLHLPEFLSIFLPLAWALGAYMALSRLWSTIEVPAAWFAAISPQALACNLLVLSGAAALVVLALSLWVVPVADRAAARVLHESRGQNVLWRLDPGIFHQIDAGWEINIDSRRGEDIGAHLLVRPGTGEAVELAWSSRLDTRPCTAEEDCSLHLTWPDGLKHANFAASGELKQTTSVGDVAMPIGELSSLPGPHRHRDAAGRDITALVHLHWHLTMPLFLLVSTMLVLALMPLAPRQGRLHRLPLVLTLLFCYLVLALGLREWVERGRLDPLIGLWPVHGGFLLLAWLFARRLAVGSGGSLWPQKAQA